MSEKHKTTNVENWSCVIKKRRLSWLGHLLRLDEETPVQKALQEYLRSVTKNRGRRKTTWIDVIRADFKDKNYKNI